MKPIPEQNQDEISLRMKAVGRVEPSVFLFAKIRHKIKEQNDQKNGISVQFVWRMAIVFLLLALVNVFVLYTNPEEITQETTEVVEELGLISDNYYDNF